jgi:hypothetical protein
MDIFILRSVPIMALDSGVLCPVVFPLACAGNIPDSDCFPAGLPLLPRALVATSSEGKVLRGRNSHMLWIDPISRRGQIYWCMPPALLQFHHAKLIVRGKMLS